VVAAVALFVSVYLAAFLAAGYAAQALQLLYVQWIALGSVVCATAVVIRVFERGRWDLGLAVPPAVAAADLLRGALLAAILIGSADAMLLLFAHARHLRDGGFPWFELVMVFTPAALHEELAFRGYIYQKIRRWNRIAAIGVTSLVFALLHLGNSGISPLAMLNLILAGVMLAMAYERNLRLWFPIAIHFVWNVLSGPILGYSVSGYDAGVTLLHTVVAGPAWLTGGAFGIEGSVCMTGVEVGGICWLANKLRISKFS